MKTRDRRAVSMESRFPLFRVSHPADARWTNRSRAHIRSDPARLRRMHKLNVIAGTAALHDPSFGKEAPNHLLRRKGSAISHVSASAFLCIDTQFMLGVKIVCRNPQSQVTSRKGNNTPPESGCFWGCLRPSA